MSVTVSDDRQRRARPAVVEPRRTLADFLREDCAPDRNAPRLRARRLRRVHRAARRRGRALVPAVRGAGRRRRGHDRSKGCARPTASSPVQEAFRDAHGLQCGFCTPGLRRLRDRVPGRDNPEPTETEIREALSGNLCRCTGYQGILAAVREAAGGAGMTASTAGRFVGQSVERREDPRLLTGRRSVRRRRRGAGHAARARSSAAQVARGRDQRV